MTRRPPRPTLFPHPPLSRSATATTTPTPAADGGRSAVTLSKSVLRGDGRDSLTVTVTLLDGSGHPVVGAFVQVAAQAAAKDRKSTRLNSSHSQISYAVFCLK